VDSATKLLKHSFYAGRSSDKVDHFNSTQAWHRGMQARFSSGGPWSCF